MHSRHIKSYGTWPSPICSDKIASDSVSLDELRINRSGTYWIEKRPAERGRCVIVRNFKGLTEDCFLEPFSARSKVHEYGGGAYCVADKGIYFVNEKDQCIYFVGHNKSRHGSDPKGITNKCHLRYADLEFDQYRNQLICICEDHSTSSSNPVNTIVALNLESHALTVLCSGYDFYSSPRLSPNGQKLAWLCWNLPNMPWDGTELWMADIISNTTDTSLTNAATVAGSETVSISQPKWSADNILYYISDESGWWNLYDFDKTPHQLTYTKFEFGLPQWVFAQSCYTFINNKEIVCAFIDNGDGNLAIFNKKSAKLSILNTPWSSFSSIRSFNNTCAFIAASTKTFPEIIAADIRKTHDKKLHAFTVKSSIKTKPDDAYSSSGNKICFTTRDKLAAFAIYYPPTNKDFLSSDNENPPLIVLAHGGPTAMADTTLDMRKQFWTSRGFALLDVNYSGSTGFGRAYRERLHYNWGIRDVEDCCDAALHVADLGLADPERLIIKGSSSGGYTVLSALASSTVFSAGASYYGISNLESLVTDTHKFESGYMEHLIGPYPEKQEIYKQRSPLSDVNNINCPVIFFQGEDDKVVPKEQAETMFEALKNKGIPVAYIPFSGEGHGFRKAETIKYALDAELAFYTRVFNLDRDDAISIKIENMD